MCLPSPSWITPSPPYCQKTRPIHARSRLKLFHPSPPPRKVCQALHMPIHSRPIIRKSYGTTVPRAAAANWEGPCPHKAHSHDLFQIAHFLLARRFSDLSGVAGTSMFSGSRRSAFTHQYILHI